MTVRIYKHQIVRIPLPSQWLFQAAEFAADYSKKKDQSDDDKAHRILRWAETWYLCTSAFVWYYGGDFEAIAERALKTGWTPSVILRAGQNKYHLTTTQVHDEWCFGSKTSGVVPQKLFARSKADIFVMSCLMVPDVDIIGWLSKEELAGALEGTRFSIKETVCRPIKECPGLAKRDKHNWYV